MASDKLSELKGRLLSRAAEDDDFRSRLVEDPRAVIAEEVGVPVPDHLSFEVHEDTAATMHLVLPPSDRLAEADLAAVSGGIQPYQNPDSDTVGGWLDSLHNPYN